MNYEKIKMKSNSGIDKVNLGDINKNEGNKQLISNQNINIEFLDLGFNDENFVKFDEVITNRYFDFVNCTVNSTTPLPNVDTRYVPQGSCQVGGYTLVVAYDSPPDDNYFFKTLGVENVKKNSLLYVLDKNGTLVNTIELDGTYHCGSVAYDGKTKSIYVTGQSGADDGRGCYVNRYAAEDILNLTNESVVATDKIKVDSNNSLKSSVNNKSSAAYLNIYNGKISIGNFSTDNNGIIKEYVLDANGKIDINSEKIIKNPYNKTQGMCIYNYHGEDYYLFSTSYGRDNDSIIYVAKRNSDDSFSTVNSVTFPCMAEQINICDNGDVSILFESAAKKYRDASCRVNDICYLDFKKLANVNTDDYYLGDFMQDLNKKS